MYPPNPITTPTPNGTTVAYASPLDLVNYRDWRQMADWISINDARGTLSQFTGTADQQTVSCSYTPTGGTFVLTFINAVQGITATITAPYNVNAATLQALLSAAPNIGPNNVVCTGGALPGLPIVVNFVDGLAGPQTLMTVNYSGLTGGTPGTMSVAHTTTGVLNNNPVVSAHLLMNSGLVETALLKGGKYQLCDIQAFTGGSQQLLTWLVCWLTVASLSRMKPRVKEEPMPEVDRANDLLDAIAHGERVFAISQVNQDAYNAEAIDEYQGHECERLSREAYRFFPARGRPNGYGGDCGGGW